MILGETVQNPSYCKAIVCPLRLEMLVPMTPAGDIGEVLCFALAVALRGPPGMQNLVSTSQRKDRSECFTLLHAVALWSNSCQMRIFLGVASVVQRNDPAILGRAAEAIEHLVRAVAMRTMASPPSFSRRKYVVITLMANGRFP